MRAARRLASARNWSRPQTKIAPPALGELLRRQRLAGEEHASYQRLRRHACQVSRSSHYPHRQLGQAEPRVFRGNDEVAGSGDRNPSTERGAVDCAYDGHTAIRNGEEGLAHSPHSLPSVLRSHRRELVKVVAGTEMRTFPTENHRANIGPDLVYVRKQRGHLLVHRLIDRIDRRSIQADVQHSIGSRFGSQICERRYGASPSSLSRLGGWFAAPSCGWLAHESGTTREPQLDRSGQGRSTSVNRCRREGS